MEKSFFISFHFPGGIGPQLWDFHHFEPSRERLWGEAEASRQPEATVQACGHESARQ